MAFLSRERHCSALFKGLEIRVKGLGIRLLATLCYTLCFDQAYDPDAKLVELRLDDSERRSEDAAASHDESAMISQQGRVSSGESARTIQSWLGDKIPFATLATLAACTGCCSAQQAAEQVATANGARRLGEDGGKGRQHYASVLTRPGARQPATNPGVTAVIATDGFATETSDGWRRTYVNNPSQQVWCLKVRPGAALKVGFASPWLARMARCGLSNLRLLLLLDSIS